MAKIYSHVEGKTLGADETFLKKLTKNKRSKRVKRVNSREDSDAIILFCTIVSRYETDLVISAFQVTR